MLTGHERRLCIDPDNLRSGHGLTQKCLRTVLECGMCVATEKPWLNLGRGIERGISLDWYLSDIARTPRGLLRGRQPVCFVICGVDFSGNCQVTCEPFRQPWCGHSPALCETFPSNCSDTARKLPGNCPDDSSDAARTAARIIAKSFANHRANFGANFGADIHRRLVRCFPPTARTRLGSCPDDSADAARTLRRTLRRTPRRMLRGLRRQLRSHLPTIVPTLVRTLARTFTGAW